MDEKEAKRLMEIDEVLRRDLDEAQALVHRISRALRWNSESMRLISDEATSDAIALARAEQRMEEEEGVPYEATTEAAKLARADAISRRFWKRIGDG